MYGRSLRGRPRMVLVVLIRGRPRRDRPYMSAFDSSAWNQVSFLIATRLRTLFAMLLVNRARPDVTSLIEILSEVLICR